MTNACLTSEHPEFKACPNCHGDGFEDSPPMRRCGVCKGQRRVPAQADKSLLRYDDHQEKNPFWVAEKACNAGQGA